MSVYLASTRHPWVCFLFLLPLIAAYEGGVWWLGGEQAARLRNGADAWFRWMFEVFGANHILVAPAVILGILLVWAWWRWADRPDDVITPWFGMAFESVVFAVILWQFSRNFGPILDGLGVTLQITVQTTPATQILTYIGAGIYEEMLFRLGLFGGLWVIFRIVQLPGIVAVVLAAVGAALAFAAAHHIGPYGEPMRTDYFVFRTIAGLYFTVLFVARGLGIAVGAHAGYDVLVGVSTT
ncbi:MAG: CPBP family glutamic-type intramembrane protease [Gemmataceae bacterium]|nr:CPBP family glutamic-type intramembrane protease [Gemmata sp.]MDW8196001.1 CPBP family glutamic-type intramembrane protease [Gemmataceae bacterium]